VAARKVDAEDCLADDLVDQRRNRRMEAATPPNFLVWQMLDSRALSFAMAKSRFLPIPEDASNLKLNKPIIVWNRRTSCKLRPPKRSSATCAARSSGEWTPIMTLCGASTTG
jgi:hypothetical protein